MSELNPMSIQWFYIKNNVWQYKHKSLKSVSLYKCCVTAKPSVVWCGHVRVWNQQLFSCRRKTFWFYLIICLFTFTFLPVYLPVSLSVCLSACLSVSLSVSSRPPEEVWGGLWVMSGWHFQLPDRGQWNTDSRLLSNTASVSVSRLKVLLLYL